MKARLDVDRLPGGRGHTSLDPVCGLVSLGLGRATEITEIVLLLRGTIRTSLIEDGPQLNLLNHTVSVSNDTHDVLTLSTVLFPRNSTASTQDEPQPATLQEGAYYYPFKLFFPLLSTCEPNRSTIRHVTATLPPSFEIHESHHGAIKIDYALEVKVRRPGLFQRDISIRQPLSFASLDPPIPLIWASSGCCEVSRKLYVNHGDRRRRPKAMTRPQTGDVPVLKLSARLPSPAVLYSEETVPLQLFVHQFPDPTERLRPIRLQSLAVVLQCRTTITLGNQQTAWTEARDLVGVSGLKMELEESRSEAEGEVLLEVDALRGISLPKVTPSFTTCTARRDYVLETVAGLTFGKEEEESQIKLMINVEIHSGESRNVENHEAQSFGLRGEDIPLRIGCLEHLRAERGSSGHVEEPLPPYSR